MKRLLQIPPRVKRAPRPNTKEGKERVAVVLVTLRLLLVAGVVSFVDGGL